MHGKLVGLLVCCACAACLGGQAAAPDYGAAAKDFADAMLAHGRDTYGALHTPLFAATLDLRTLRMPATTSEATRQLYTKYFRSDDFATSSNPMFDTDFYQLLNALTPLTGDPKYREAADDALRYFFDHCQSPATGLMAWGEHIGWDLVDDKVTIQSDGKSVDIHEFFGPWIHWTQSLRVAPEACHRFALGLWHHQICDPATCAFSRHAHFSKHGPGRGYEFARDAGFYIATWAAVYETTRDPELLHAIRQLLAAYRRWRIPETGLLPFETQSPRVVFVLNQLSFMVDVSDSAARVPPDLGREMRAFVAELDESFFRIPQDLQPGGRGFAKIVDGQTREVTNRVLAESPGREAYLKKNPRLLETRYLPYGGRWGSDYGAAAYTDARHALLCGQRYRQSALPRYRELLLATADRYLDAEPPAGETLTPKTLAPVLGLLNTAFRCSGDAKYLARSEHFADLALRKFFRPGCPLPCATERCAETPYYVAESHPGSLMLMLLDLGLLKSGKTNDVPVQCSIR